MAKNEYIFYKNNQHVWITDKQLLIKDIYKRKLENSFEKYMMEGKQAQPLLNWMKSNGYQEKEIQNLCTALMGARILENSVKYAALQQKALTCPNVLKNERKIR